jgi:hypothetical protein
VANAGYRRFLAAPTGNGFTIDPDKVAADAQFDGLFVLRTNMKLSTLAVVLRYRTYPLHLPGTATPQGVARSTCRPPHTDAGMAAHHRRSARPQCRRSRAGRPSCHPAHRTQSKHRPICRAIGLTLPPIFQEMPTAQTTQDPI